jgi:hypothetical protein
MKHLFTLALSLGLFSSPIFAASAVQPAPISSGDKVEWSKVVENPFDGKIVYDKNFNDEFVFVSSWSTNGIRATYTQLKSELVGYETVWHTRTYHDRKGRRVFERYPHQEPIYRRFSISAGRFLAALRRKMQG